MKREEPQVLDENWCSLDDMQRAFDAGVCDLAMPDVMKIGGVTGWMRAAAHARGVPMRVAGLVAVDQRGGAVGGRSVLAFRFATYASRVPVTCSRISTSKARRFPSLNSSSIRLCCS